MEEDLIDGDGFDLRYTAEALEVAHSQLPPRGAGQREFQSYYGWSPVTTSLAAGADPKVSPPTDNVQRIWEK